MKYGLIGEKLGHSFSKEIHEQIGSYEYELCELAREDVEAFFKERSFDAINVTIPYKEVIIPYLDKISDTARKIGAVNTVVNRGGKLFGYNTDYNGAAALIRRLGIEVKNKKVLILGTGGTSKTLSAVVTDMGAAEIIHVSRKSTENTVTYEEALLHHTDADIIVNTTPVGMYPKNEGCPIDIDAFSDLIGVVDVIYNPLDTCLVQKAKERGIKASGGLYMLSAQAVYAAALFVDGKAEENVIDRAYASVLSQKKNIVLVGMPSSGKSSVGQKLATLLNREFIDTDSEIVKREGKEISAIFSADGEKAFRNIESEVIYDVAKRNGVVISTGGGAILDPANVKHLSQNSVIFFLDRSPDKLIATSDRPLSSDREALKKRYDERYPIYNSVADVRIDGNGTVQEVADLVKDSFLGEQR